MNATRTTEKSSSYDVVILGAGYAGLMAALRLSRRKWPLRIALVSAQDQFLERVRLQESIVAAVAPRIASISAFVAGTTIEFICGNVTSLDPDLRHVQIQTDTQMREIVFDQAIFALGSNIDVEDVPGAAENAYRLEAGNGPHSAAALRSTLRVNADRPMHVITVGGAETAIEVAGEIKTAWPGVKMTMVCRSRCGASRGPRVERAVRAELIRLGVELIDGETVIEVGPAEVVTNRGRSLACDICVWSGGLRSAPVARGAGLATDPQDRIWVDANLRSVSHPHILAVGDAVHPIAPTGAPYRLSAFSALVSGAYAADAILANRAKRRIRPFSFSTFGQGIAIGRSGVGFFSYPDDRQALFIVKGQTARQIRNFFVWLVSYVLTLERRMPGSFFWPGRRRVSWDQANDALQKAETAKKLQIA
ncbi:NAD(P)/FAD-dependent oxidoreductase [Mesorhizobium qingshengii]|uniref:NADH dehydrogenase, FAD-containing subunit n=1 Tax=Mesorhizobium qingshengii TaxID=1165689 RepID=A0A1G5WK40_9HYPH|nr:FAD-dependent oxidoreductase [Mesorhizobium qingshengii]SDA57887.1 NADH dehydrogenase, FAD-containing subunit [Mesorhizobium qingshengii]